MFSHPSSGIQICAILSLLGNLVSADESLRLGPEDIPIDFSVVGYGAGAEIPWVPAVLRMDPVDGDNTAMLQAAIDQVAGFPIQENGFRGAIELNPGFYMVDGQLKMTASGIVLRGTSQDRRETVLLANGMSRRALISIEGKLPQIAEPVRVTSDVEAGNISLKLESVEGFVVGSRLVITRPSTAEWIHDIGTDFYENAGHFADLRVFWRPGSRDLIWDRTVVEVDTENQSVILDAPITTAMLQKWGGGYVQLVNDSETVSVNNVGVEHLTLLSYFDGVKPMDEDHAWFGIQIDQVDDVWVQDVGFQYFVDSAVRVGPRARRVSVFNCDSSDPVSELGGYRRWTYWIEGQQVWVEGCTAKEGLNDFTAGQLAGGPIVFRDCRSEDAKGDSGTFESWASGVLYEDVEIQGAGLCVTKDWNRTQGAGWTAGNSYIWNCKADKIVVKGHESAPNYSFTSENSLFAEQCSHRQKDAEPRIEERLPDSNPDSVQLFVFDPGSVQVEEPDSAPLEIVNGRFVIDGKTVWGGFIDEKWWRGQTLPKIAVELAQRSITRFCPGREGPGLTERLDEMADDYFEAGHRVFYGGVGLWYDRRRDDHFTDARDSNVWAPFYEMPWARTGKGKAYDGLSKYDLGTYNSWFFDRTLEFSQELANRGMVHLHYLYNTHNVLETLAHYSEFPWRPANCVNDVGLKEPPPIDANNTVHLANEFYNVDDPERKELHRAYIFQTLDWLAETRTLVITLGTQFAGPLEFQKFFINTVAEWESETGIDAKLMLETSKDITDAILADPEFEKNIDVVSMRYWQYLPDGSLWAPRGDRNLAFREMNTIQFGTLTDHPPQTTPLLGYQQVREYRDDHPNLAVISWHGGVGSIPALMAGAANVIQLYRPLGTVEASMPRQPELDGFIREEISPWLMHMNPVDGMTSDPETNWCLADEGFHHVLLYSQQGDNFEYKVELLPQTRAVWFQPESGERRKMSNLNATPMISKPDGRDWLLWMTTSSSDLEGKQ